MDCLGVTSIAHSSRFPSVIHFSTTTAHGGASTSRGIGSPKLGDCLLTNKSSHLSHYSLHHPSIWLHIQARGIDEVAHYPKWYSTVSQRPVSISRGGQTRVFFVISVIMLVRRVVYCHFACWTRLRRVLWSIAILCWLRGFFQNRHEEIDYFK